MTPGARVAAAIDVLGLIAEGQPAEKALTSWARRSRFAGSKDRAAVRDHVFGTLRNWRSDAVRGGGETGRARMIGRLRDQGDDLDALFHGEGHAPAPLNDDERAISAHPVDETDVWDLPDWLIAEFKTALGDSAAAAAQLLKTRAPVTLRVNSAKVTPSQATTLLAEAGVEVEPNPLCDTALTITEGPRKLRNSEAYLDGFVELQDAASQAVISALPAGQNVLDYCAGGGGKSLGMAAQKRSVVAHDVDFDRMRDLPDRARRADAQIKLLATDMLAQEGPFDIVLVDAPCSGSGAWRRSPEAKWNLTVDRLGELTAIQDEILDQVQSFVAKTGTLVFATCSVLKCENEDRVAAFLSRNSGWECTQSTRIDLSENGDGFFHAHLTRVQ
jgi:16S rRNA (cytosine967-C5)-methyltransferase